MLRRFLGDQPHEVRALGGRVVNPGETVDCPDTYPGTTTPVEWPPSLWETADPTPEPAAPPAEEA